MSCESYTCFFKEKNATDFHNIDDEDERRVSSQDGWRKGHLQSLR